MERNTITKNAPRHTQRAYKSKAAFALLILLTLTLAACGVLPSAGEAAKEITATSVPQSAAPVVETEQSEQPVTATPKPLLTPAPEKTAAPVERSRFAAEIDADPDNSHVEVRLSLDYVNDTPNDLYELTLRLWPNAVYTGCLELSSVTQEDADSYYTLSMNDSALTIPINRDLHPGDRVNIGMTYTIKVPTMEGRFGVNELGMNLGNILPTVAPYENGAWRLDEYLPTGDSFYSEASDYTVLISCPQKYAVAASGTAGEGQYIDDKQLYECVYTAKPARDFALSLTSNTFVETRRSENGVRVLAYSKQNSRSVYLAETAASAISYFEAKLGAYPYADFCAVGTEISGGMEYPGLIMVDYEGLDGNERQLTELFIAHEVAHQWFYNTLGSDQYREPWVDEALVEYLSFDYIRSLYGQDYMKSLWSSRFHDIVGYSISLPLDAPLSDFTKAPAGDYVYGVYARGSAFYDALYAKMGEEKFYGALKKLITDNHFGIVNGQSLLKALSDASGENVNALFESYRASQPGAGESSVVW